MEMKKYKFISANEYCVRVFDGTHDSPKPCEKGYKLLTSKNILAGELDKTSAYYISENDYNAINQRSQVQQYDILFSMIGSVGNVCFVKDSNIDFAIKNMGVFSCENKEKALYLYYYLQSPFAKKMIDSYLNGAVQKFLGLERLRNFPILEYSTDKQKIAAVLSFLDDKIALNKKINTKLEAMAKRLYDYWFVQFDFPNEEGKPYKSSGGKMEYNATLKRDIPVGWEVKSINEVCDVIDCLHSKKPDFCYEDEDSYLLSLENITKEGYIDISEKYYISKKDFSEWTSRICVKENDFLFTNAGRAGDMGMIPNGIKCAIGRNITAVRSKKINPYYLRCFFKSLYMKEQILNNLDKGCFFMSFNVRSIKQLSILIPKEENFHKFISFCEPIIKQLNKNNSEIQKLTKLRDRLLPLLMNGQVKFN